MNETNGDDPIRERLLDAAERLFADKGFAAVSVREITAAAEAHTAAVNYHFGGKQALYLAVFQDRVLPRIARASAPLAALEGRQDLTAEKVIRTLAGVFLANTLSKDERRRQVLLVSREMANPGRAFEMIAEKRLMPTLETAAHLLARTLDMDASALRLRLSVLSVVAQGLYFAAARPVVGRVAGREFDDALIEELIEHVTAFSLGGLSRMQP